MGVVALHPAAKLQRELLDPPLVYAPAPDDPSKSIPLEISRATLEKLAAAQRRTNIFEAWAHLVGELPPVPNAQLYLPQKRPNTNIATIRDAVACFKGVKRPYGLEDTGQDVYVYIINSEYTVRWGPDMVCVADILPVPEGVVMTAQVRPAASLQIDNDRVWGAITKWEFVSACSEQPRLPDDHAARYDATLWQR